MSLLVSETGIGLATLRFKAGKWLFELAIESKEL